MKTLENERILAFLKLRSQIRILPGVLGKTLGKSLDMTWRLLLPDSNFGSKFFSFSHSEGPMVSFGNIMLLPKRKEKHAKAVLSKRSKVLVRRDPSWQIHSAGSGPGNCLQEVGAIEVNQRLPTRRRHRRSTVRSMVAAFQGQGVEGAFRQGHHAPIELCHTSWSANSCSQNDL